MPSSHEAEDRAGDFAALEPLSTLRAHPEWYFQSGEFERETVASLLVREALFSDRVTQAWTRKDGRWTAVIADGDWLEGDSRAFSVPTPFPESGVNAIRVEVLLTAFCDTVVTAAAGREDHLQSAAVREMPQSMTDRLNDTDSGRVIVFHAPAVSGSHGTVVQLFRDLFSSVAESPMDRWERAHA
jgi:hypothetical protein